VRRSLLNALLYFPARAVRESPASIGLEYEDLELIAADGVRLHGWWVAARGKPRGHVLLFHGNGGNIADRVLHVGLLAGVGFDVLLFDYRGYGRSGGRPGEEGTYLDARAALACLLRRPGVDPSQVILLGESLGGAVALEVALERPPAGVVLLSAFTGIRALARLHYPFVPAPLVPDAYPSLRRIRRLERVPVLVIHGDEDDVVPVEHGRALFDAAPGPKRLRLFEGLGHNDLLVVAGREAAREIADWADSLEASPTS
jgi:fermentation-respiration switch protein FrsA (DUF1100 family)